MKKLILASGSPRRREIMELAGLPFAIRVSQLEEVVTSNDPIAVVKELAEQKAAEIAGLYKGCVLEEFGEEPFKDGCIIGADTVVAYKGSILGKPEDREDAVRMLHMLSGHIHHVYTGVCIIWLQNGLIVDKKKFHEETEMEMYPLTEEEILAYVATGEADDKAGAYGVQGKACTLIKRINGDYYNAVGLPIARLVREIC